MDNEEHVDSFRQLAVWQRAMELALAVLKLADEFPTREDSAFTAQLCQAVVAVPSKIAHGYARSSRHEYASFLSAAHGSICEAETLLLLAKDLGYAPEEAVEALFADCEEIGGLLESMRRRLVSPHHYPSRR
jgi:four helix bundle protein